METNCEYDLYEDFEDYDESLCVDELEDLDESVSVDEIWDDELDELKLYQAEKKRDENDEYEEYDEEYANRGYGGNEWTEEDAWDAMTDGMYGEMPRNPWAYDAMMDAMGY